MKRFTVASLTIVLLAGFWLFPDNSTAQLFQASGLFSYGISSPYSAPFATGGSTSDWSNLMNTRSALSFLPATNTNTNGSLGTQQFRELDIREIWEISSAANTNGFLSTNSYLSLASPISQLSLSNQFYLGNQFSYGNQFPSQVSLSLTSRSSASLFPPASLFPASSYSTSPYPRWASNSPFSSGISFPGLFPGTFPGLFPGTSPSVPSSPQVPQVVKLSYKAETDKADYGPAEPIQIGFTITNSDTKSVTLNFTSGKQFDVIAKNSAGAAVWQLSSNRFYTMAITTIKLNSGEEKKLTAQWDQKDDHGAQVPDGSYTIEAFLTSTDKNYGQIASTQITITASSVAEKEPLPTFSSCAKLREKLDEITNASYGYGAKGGIYYDMAVPMMAAFNAAEGTRVATGSMDTANAVPAGASAGDYSTTNVQVEGVDEADRIKNDGAYIYMIKGKSVRIIKAYPADEMKEMPKIDFEKSTFTPSQLYIDGNALVVIGNDYAVVEDSSSASPGTAVGIMAPAIRAPSYYPYYIRQSSLTRVIIYDTTDRAKVTEKRNLKFEGNYLQSRRVDDTVYVIMNQYPQYFPVYTGEKNPVPLDTPDTMIPRYADSMRSANNSVNAEVDKTDNTATAGNTGTTGSTDTAGKADKAICDC